ncbi:YdcF family protein [Noviherbaspirillum pedocola]|uniref:YdcF family protein n=1 Tax=Noviherbaspirillum pedocola TaxID=2801341 RepID=UPI002D7FE8DF|nr:YdcF family protein [Noviherbaspirillum pedocola]
MDALALTRRPLLSAGIGAHPTHSIHQEQAISKGFDAMRPPISAMYAATRIISLTTILSCVLLLGSVAAILADGMRDDIGVSDIGIVLGSKVLPDGQSSARLRARLDRAAELYQRGMFRHIIVSGGFGTEGFSEAARMADYLSMHGKVPRASLILDEHGDTAADTARNAAAIMRSHGYRSALVITQYFHISRSRYALRREGITGVHSAHARYAEARDVYSIARELVALPAYWLHSP